MNIRPARVSDIPAITEIYGYSVQNETASFELEAPDEAEMLTRFTSIKEAGFPYFVAEEDGAVLGYAYAGAYHPRPAYRFVVENSIYLTSQARGKGVGKALLKSLIEKCEAMGLRQMIAVIGSVPGNEPSVALHKSLGFHTIGDIESAGWKFDRWHSVRLMQRPLGEGDTTLPSL